MRRGPLWKGFVPETTPPLTEAERLAFAHQHILITGAGGYLGGALARSLASVPGVRLTLLDLAEHGLYRLGQRLQIRGVRDFRLVVGSVADRALLKEWFRSAGPEIVFHAAARKHVPLMQTNQLAAAEANILGTQALVNAVQQAGTRSFLLLSTDKAVEPISAMGATKRIAEQVVLAARLQTNSVTDLKAVRLCNVLGSTGSVAPLFARQIAGGGPVTITHAEATRFFLPVQDAVRHLLRAALTEAAHGLLVPRLQSPSRVLDLATYMVAQAPRPRKPFTFTYTGLRPADKLHERLLALDEVVQGATDAPLQQVLSAVDVKQLSAALPRIEAAVQTRDQHMLLDAMQQAAPEYHARTSGHPQEIP